LINLRRLLIPLLIAGLFLGSPTAAFGGTVGPGLLDRIQDLRQDTSSLAEEVEDLGEPVEEFDIFDQCMHFVGVTEYGSSSGDFGYFFGNAALRLRPALAMDMRGFDPPEYQLLAFPGEEPPSIECNEDAGGLFTN
jgi:hypothetical protein